MSNLDFSLPEVESFWIPQLAVGLSLFPRVEIIFPSRKPTPSSDHLLGHQEMPSSNTSPRHAARAPMALSCAAECALSLACARWALRRLSLSGADDSASWPAASPSSFAPVRARAAPRSRPGSRGTTRRSRRRRRRRRGCARRTASPTTARVGTSCSPCAG